MSVNIVKAFIPQMKCRKPFPLIIIVKKYCSESTSYETKEIPEKALKSSKKKKCTLANDKDNYIEKDGEYYKFYTKI